MRRRSCYCSTRPFLFFPTALVCSPNCSNRAASRSGNRPAFGERGWECYLCLGSARGREPGGEFGKRVPNKVKVFQSFIFALTGRALPLLNNPVPVLDCPIVCPPPPPQGALTSPFHLVFSFSCLNSPNVCLHLELQGPRLHTTPPPHPPTPLSSICRVLHHCSQGNPPKIAPSGSAASGVYVVSAHASGPSFFLYIFH